MQKICMLALSVLIAFQPNPWPVQLTASAEAVEVPTSRRAKRAENRVRPQLERDLESLSLEYGAPVFIRIFKEEKELEVWLEGEADEYVHFRTYDICTYSGDLGPKLREGDNQSPEGFYFVKPIQMNPSSTFHLSFNIGFPNSYDRAHGRTGSFLMVHGHCVSIGCYAMTNKRIDEIFSLASAALREGQPFFRVHIFPFRMTEENMIRYEDHNWIEFWENLKEGYDLFELDRIPPNVSMEDKTYFFEN